MGKNVFISGSGNVVEGLENFAAVNCQDQTFTKDNEGQTVINNGVMVVTSDEITVNKPLLAPTGKPTLIRDADFQVDIAHGVYFIDCTSADVTVTLDYTGIDYVFVKTDASANNVIIDPSSGNINGAVTYSFNTQYAQKRPLYDGTNWFV